MSRRPVCVHVQSNACLTEELSQTQWSPPHVGHFLYVRVIKEVEIFNLLGATIRNNKWIHVYLQLVRSAIEFHTIKYSSIWLKVIYALKLCYICTKRNYIVITLKLKLVDRWHRTWLRDVYCQNFRPCGMRVHLNLLLLPMVGEQAFFLRL